MSSIVVKWRGSRNLDILAEEMIWADYDEEQLRGVVYNIQESLWTEPMRSYGQVLTSS